MANLPGHADVFGERFIVSNGEAQRLLKPQDFPTAKLPNQPLDLPLNPDKPNVLSPDGRTFVADSQDSPSQATLWDLADLARPTVAATLPGTADRELWSAAFSGDSKLLATKHSPGSLLLWDLTDPHHPARLAELAPTADGRNQLREISTPLALAPDGKTLVSGDLGGTFTMWDISDPRNPMQLTTLTAQDLEEPQIRFSPDGNAVAIDNVLWKIEDLNRLRSDTVEQACKRAGRGLNEAEWALYVPGIAYRNTC